MSKKRTNKPSTGGKATAPAPVADPLREDAPAAAPPPEVEPSATPESTATVLPEAPQREDNSPAGNASSSDTEREPTPPEPLTAAERAELVRSDEEVAAIRGPIPVRAVRQGYYDHLREVGETFSVRSEQELGRWMQRLDTAQSSAGVPAADGDTAPAGAEGKGPTGEQSVI